MASVTKRFVVSVGMNWVAMAVNMVVPFFLTPFVVRHLGTVQYGIWILAVSTVSYLALLDLGLRSAVIRFVSKAEAEGNLAEGTKMIGAALWFRVLIALGVSVLSILLAYVTPHFFKIPASLVYASRVTVLACALGVAVTLISGVFGAVLAAIHRFDLLSSIAIVQTILRAAGVLLILRSGRGLIALAYWEFTVILVVGLITCVTALKIFPTARTPLRRPDSGVLREIWTYSLTTFVFMIAVQIIINTDSLVIGAFLSVGMVTFYSIGSSLVSYASQVSSAVSTTFMPMASGYDATGRADDLRRMLLRGTQAMLGLVFPVALALIFRGKTFISIWMGPKYGVVSETVLQILMISLFFSMADSTAGAIMMAIDKHKPVARWAVYEAVLNLGLSIMLIKTVGLYGVAWGTSISMMITHLAFYPRYVKKVLGVPIRDYVWHGWGKVSLCAVPFGIVSYMAERYWRATTLPMFFGQIIATLPVYGLCIVIMFRRETFELISKLKRSRVITA
jgi:O-antigen/teichoic acid export membrane protein